MFGGVGPMEIVLVLAIALIVLGPKKLPEAARSVGKGLREFRESVSGFNAEEEEEDDPTPEPALEPEPSQPPR